MNDTRQIKRELARAKGRQLAEEYQDKQLQLAEKSLKRIVYLAPSLFFAFLLPKAISAYFSNTGMMTLAVETGVGATILGLAWVHVKVADPLRYGKSKEANFFRNNWPTALLSKEMKLTTDDQDALNRIWLQFFLALAFPSSEYRPHVIWNYRRTYGARMVWLTIRALDLMISIGSLAIIFDFCRQYWISENVEKVALFAQLLIVIACLFARILIKNANSLTNGATGCWLAVRNEMALQHDIFKTEIGKVAGIDKLRKNVDQWEWRLTDRMLEMNESEIKLPVTSEQQEIT